MGRSTVKRQVNHPWGAVLWVFLYFWPVVWFLFPRLTCLEPSPTCVCSFFPRGIPAQRPMGSLDITSSGWCPLLFDPQRSFLCVFIVSLVPRMGKIWPLDLLVPLCSCHQLPLSVLRSQGLAIYPGSVVIPISKYKQEARCKYLTWSPSVSYLKRCRLESSYKCPAWNPSFSHPPEVSAGGQL